MKSKYSTLLEMLNTEKEIYLHDQQQFVMSICTNAIIIIVLLLEIYTQSGLLIEQVGPQIDELEN
jgi:hypothetical protein